MREAAVSGPDARRGLQLVLAGLWLLDAVPRPAMPPSAMTKPP